MQNTSDFNRPQSLARAQALFGGVPWPIYDRGQVVEIDSQHNEGKVIGWWWDAGQWMYIVEIDESYNQEILEADLTPITEVNSGR
jgi:hypothetical protein